MQIIYDLVHWNPLENGDKIRTKKIIQNASDINEVIKLGGHM
jgi:hypothetical protein